MRFTAWMLAWGQAAAGAAAVAPVAVPPPTAVVAEITAATPGDHRTTFAGRLDGQPVSVAAERWVPADRGSAAALPLVVSLSATDDGDPACHQFAAGVGPEPAECLAVRPPTGHRWGEPSAQRLLRELIDRVVAADHLDGTRVYLTATGSASADAWTLGGVAPWAGLGAVGGSAPADPSAAVESWWQAGVELSASDAAARPAWSALGARPHRSWRAVPPSVDPYADPSFWGWLLAQRRSTATPFNGRAFVGPSLPVLTPPAPPKGGVAVTFDPHALPTTPGYAVVKATVRLGDRTLPFDFGVYLPPGWPHAVGFRGGPVPVLVNLHWREFFGGDDRLVTTQSLPNLVVGSGTERRHTGDRPADPVPLANVAPAVLILPHCPAGCRYEWTPGMAEAVGLLIDQAVPALHADADRVCLTGVSYGGSSTWIVGERIAGRLAAVVPCDGRRTADPAATAAALANVGVYLSAGDVDGDFTNDARSMARAFTAAAHADLVYRETHEGGHFCFSATYTDPAFWAWLTTQRRAPADGRRGRPRGGPGRPAGRVAGPLGVDRAGRRRQGRGRRQSGDGRQGRCRR